VTSSTTHSDGYLIALWEGGSTKQRAWARRVKANALRIADSLMEQSAELLAPATATPEQLRLMGALSMVHDELGREDRTAWWIDHREIEGDPYLREYMITRAREKMAEADADADQAVEVEGDPQFDFQSNGDIYTSEKALVGRIDSDGEVRVDGDGDQPELEAEILDDLRAQFAGRSGGNWPDRADWPIELLRALGERGAS